MDIVFCGTVAEFRNWLLRLKVSEEILKAHIEREQKKRKWFGHEYGH